MLEAAAVDIKIISLRSKNDSLKSLKRLDQEFIAKKYLLLLDFYMSSHSLRLLENSNKLCPPLYTCAAISTILKAQKLMWQRRTIIIISSGN